MPKATSRGLWLLNVGAMDRVLERSLEQCVAVRLVRNTAGPQCSVQFCVGDKVPMVSVGGGARWAQSPLRQSSVCAFGRTESAMMVLGI